MRIAYVGGGASGIGRAIAEQLAAAGHRVVIFGRRAEALALAAKEIPGDVSTLVADISDFPVDLERPDVVVINAGGPPPGRILDVDDDAWQVAFDLLMRGPLRLARQVLPGMAARGFGRIVFVTSTAVRQPQPDLAASVVLRSAVTAAAKLLSREYAHAGVTVNCVAPGPTATERRHEILAARARRTGASLASVDADDLAAVPAGRAGHPDEIAAAVAFLVSDAAGYVNGTVLTVDGGRTETI